MAAISYTPAVANQRPAGFKRVFIGKGTAGTGTEKWQSLGFIKDGELSFGTKSEMDSLMRNLAYGADFKATFKMLQTGKATTTEMKLINEIVDGSNSFLFEMTDATTSNDKYVKVLDTQVGATAKLVINGEPSSIRYIEITITGTVLLVDMDDCVNPTVEATDFQVAGTSGGTFALIGSSGSTGAWTSVNLGHKDRMLPAGISSVQIQNADDAGYDTLGKLKNANITCEWVSENDSMGRPQPYAVDVTLEYEHLESQITGNLDQMQVWAGFNLDAKVTCFDATVITFESKLGFDASYIVSGNFDKFAVVKHTHKGRILMSAFDAMITS